MSNNIHIPASKDTLFMRGFSYRQDIEHIRDFFARECGGRNTVEFFKDDGNDQLFLALRFESKEIAKEVMHRFNDTEVLGDRITMTWYKDLRRTRQPYSAADNYRRPAYRGNYDSYNNDYRDRNVYNSRSSNYKPKYSETSQQVASRTRRYTRSSSHSRSRSLSRSASASRSRSRSSSHSYDSRENKKKRTSQAKKSKIAKKNDLDYKSSHSETSPPPKASKKLVVENPEADTSPLPNQNKKSVEGEHEDGDGKKVSMKQKKIVHSDVEDTSPVNNTTAPPNSAATRTKGFEEEEERVQQRKRRGVEDVPTNDFETDINKRTKYEDGKMKKRQEASMQRGMVGMSSDKILLIKQKKEEIEKAYRQDCETFATVTKLLISKDPELEDKIQMSLRENLKDIGQRCIQELREFVERVKNDDEL